MARVRGHFKPEGAKQKEADQAVHQGPENGTGEAIAQAEALNQPGRQTKENDGNQPVEQEPDGDETPQGCDEPEGRQDKLQGPHQKGAQQADHTCGEQSDLEVGHFHAQGQPGNQQEDGGSNRPLEQPEQGTDHGWNLNGTFDTIGMLLKGSNGTGGGLPQSPHHRHHGQLIAEAIHGGADSHTGGAGR